MGRVLLLIVVVALIVWWVARRRAAAAAKSSAAPADPLRAEAGQIGVRDISVGGVVSYEARDYVVRGTLELDQGGFVWHEHLLDDASTHRRWLSVEDDEDLEVCWWETLAATDLSPGGPVIEHEGVTFRLEEQGSARFVARGTTGTATEGTVEYYDYAAGDDRLAFERFGGGSWEVSRGKAIPPRSLDVYPAPRS